MRCLKHIDASTGESCLTVGTDVALPLREGVGEREELTPSPTYPLRAGAIPSFSAPFALERSAQRTLWDGNLTVARDDKRLRRPTVTGSLLSAHHHARRRAHPVSDALRAGGALRSDCRNVRL